MQTMSVSMGIRQKLAMALLAITLAILLISYVAFYFRSQALLKHEVHRSLLATAELAAEQLEARVDAIERAMEQVYSRTHLRHSLKAWNTGERSESVRDIQRILADARNATRGINDLVVLSAQGEYVAAVRSDFSRAGLDPALLTKARTSAGYLGILNPGSPEQQLLIGAPMALDGELLGSLVVLFATENFESFGARSALEAARLQIVVTVQQAGRQLRILPVPRANETATPAFNPFSAARQGTVLSEAVDYRGVPVIAAMSVLPRLDWGLTVKVEQDVVYESMRQQTNFLLLLGGVCLLIALVSAVLLSGAMTRPILDIKHIAELIAHGDIHRRVEHLTRDELGQLAAALNLMADRLLSLRVELERRVQQQQQDLVKLGSDLNAANGELTRLSLTDALTGVANRRAFEVALTHEWQRCRRQQVPLAVLMIDIDHFKRLNDSLGHQAGDEALRRVAVALRAGLRRPGDLVARLGGEEFAALLPDSSSEGALALGETLRAAVQAAAIPHPASPVAGVVTISVGIVCAVPDGVAEPTALLAQADKALYEAKTGGRNRVHLDSAASTATTGN